MTSRHSSESKPHRVLIVDDSRTIRALLRVTLEADPRLTVIGEASDPFEAREKIKALSPDVITLDVEMPKMNGLEFLEKLMRLRPMPVVMVSTRTTAHSEHAVRALRIGAVDCVDVAGVQSDARQRSRLVETLVTAAGARVAEYTESVARAASPLPDGYRWNGKVIVLGSSTGGVDAIERVLAPFPSDGPPVIIAQHMPEAFLRSLSHRLNDLVAPQVRLARAGDVPKQGLALIAPGGAHHVAFAKTNTMQLDLTPATDDDLYVPAVNELFCSAAPHASHIVGVILTGMGRDGADGLRLLRDRGAATFAQQGDTCVVDGMPRAARDAGAVETNVPIGALGRAILDACTRARKPADA